jgi:hypothetical protein
LKQWLRRQQEGEEEEVVVVFPIILCRFNRVEGLPARPRRRWENIKMYVQEIRLGVDWIDLSCNKWLVTVNGVSDLLGGSIGIV